MTISVQALFVVETAAKILERGLEVAQAVGLPVTSWSAGDPTRSLYKYLAEVLATLEGANAEYIKAGFLSEASGEWLTVLAWEVYGVEREVAGYATPTVTLRNAGGGFYPIEDIGELTVKSSASDKTFRTNSTGTLSAGATVTFDLIADEPGSDSSVAANEIDELVTTLLGVEVVSSTAATALDEQSDDALKKQCYASLGALSPNGPADAYEYVVRNSKLTGNTEVTRAKGGGDSSTGEATVYVASADGAVSGAGILAAQNAVERWATPLCITPTVASAVEEVFNIAASVQGDDLPNGWEALVTTALARHFAGLEIGAPVSRSKLIQVIHNAVAAIESVTLSTPATDVALAANAVPVLGTVTLAWV